MIIGGAQVPHFPLALVMGGICCLHLLPTPGTNLFVAGIVIRMLHERIPLPRSPVRKASMNMPLLTPACSSEH